MLYEPDFPDPSTLGLLMQRAAEGKPAIIEAIDDPEVCKIIETKMQEAIAVSLVLVNAKTIISDYLPNAGYEDIEKILNGDNELYERLKNEQH